jgi:hypothetical protein
MQRFHIKFLLLAIASFQFFACENVIDLPTDDEPELFVFSNFSDQNSLQVFVSKSRSIQSDSPKEFVNNAVVNVYAGGKLIEQLTYFPGDSSSNKIPYYQSLNLVPEFDKEYTIEVIVDGFETITATNSIPTPVNIEDVSFTPQLSSGKGHQVVVNFVASVSLRDPLGIENYYHLKFYQELVPFTVVAAEDTLKGASYYINPSNVEKVDPANISLIKYSNDQSYLLKDTYFDGKYITLNFKGKFTFDETESKPERFMIELRTVSKAYYLYHESLNWQIQENGNPGEGDVVFNNIDNGVGNFSGFASKYNTFKLTD